MTTTRRDASPVWSEAVDELIKRLQWQHWQEHRWPGKSARIIECALQFNARTLLPTALPRHQYLCRWHKMMREHSNLPEAIMVQGALTYASSSSWKVNRELGKVNVPIQLNQAPTMAKFGPQPSLWSTGTDENKISGMESLPLSRVTKSCSVHWRQQAASFGRRCPALSLIQSFTLLYIFSRQVRLCQCVSLLPFWGLSSESSY